jgi:hypothetical protein
LRVLLGEILIFCIFNYSLKFNSQFRLFQLLQPFLIAAAFSSTDPFSSVIPVKISRRVAKLVDLVVEVNLEIHKYEIVQAEFMSQAAFHQLRGSFGLHRESSAAVNTELTMAANLL